eukprot:TCONS_00060729-protein
MAPPNQYQENQDQENLPPGIVTILHLLDNDDVLQRFIAEMDRFTEKWFIRLVEWLIAKRIINIDRQKFNCLERNFYGGGSSTMAWLNKMATHKPGEQVIRLRECARINERGDVLKILQNIANDFLISKLNHGTRAQIADCLDERVVAAADWSAFASHFGYGYKDRQQFKAAQIPPNSFSPTIALLDILIHENEELPIDHIIRWAKSREAGRNDIGKLLEEFKISFLERRNQARVEGRNQAGNDGGGNQRPVADGDDVRAENMRLVMNAPQNPPPGAPQSNDNQNVPDRSQSIGNADHVDAANGHDGNPPLGDDNVDRLADRISNSLRLRPDGTPDLS